MNWKKPVFTIGAVLLCTSLLMADTPSGQANSSAAQFVPAKVIPSQITALDMAQDKAQRTPPAKKPQAVLPKTPALAGNLVGATPGAHARGAIITIEIFTDNYGSETTWELVEQGVGTVASGGPYDYMNPLLYTYDVDVDPLSCYDFTIYDQYGDGICCSYGLGYYNVSYEGDLICTGGEFGSSETCPNIGGGCDPVEGCAHSVVLYDDYGDGWNSCSLDVLVNGAVVLDDITIVDGAGPETFTFFADTGDTITTVFTPVSWAYECSYYIYDGAGTEICADGLGGVEPVGCTCTGFCPAATTIDIVIFTDNYGSETTWELTEWGGGVVASGGPYNSSTLYEIAVEVNPASCYDWTIYDAYGDGICCAYGDGYYEVYYEGELFCSGGVFGSSETCTGIGGGCEWPTGACCLNQECVFTGIQPECDAVDGTFYEGEDCATFECPASLVECPPGSLFSQRPHLPDEVWSFGNADADANGSNYLRAESFSVDGDICDIHWWGIWAYLSGSWMECDESDPTFEIKFYEDAGGQPGAEVCSYTVVPDQIQTGEVYLSLFEMVYFSVELLNPCCIITDGWVSIQGFGDTDCWFMWASSPIGDGSSFFSNNGAPEPYAYDLAVCLTGEYVPRWGACCDDSTGICVDDVEQQDCPPPMRFTADTLCDDLDPPCGEIPGACCCPDGTCEITVESECYDPCFWLGAYTTCDECPPLGACCVEDEGEYYCVATNWEFECDGRWYEGEDCFGVPPFECPETDADFIIQAPHTGEIYTTCGAGNDCPIRASEDHTYEVIIPTDGIWTFSLCRVATWDTYMYLGSTLCGNEIAENDDYCGLVSEINSIPLYAGNYFIDVEAYGTSCGDYALDVWEEIQPTGACCVDMDCVETNYELECDAMGGDWYEGYECPGFDCPPPCGECPEGGIPEAEPCGEDTNGGCNMADPQFEPIECGTTICGTGWFDGGTRDTDWYELVLTESMTITLSLQAEFDALFGKIGQYVPGVPGCANTTGSVDPYAVPLACEWATVATACMPAGTYYIFVAPQFTNIETCPSNYVLTIDCEACVVLGACCVEEECVETNELPDCDLLGGDWFIDETCPEFICPHLGPDFFVEAPYTSPLRDACGSDDCTLRDTEEHTYEVIIPYASVWNFNTCLDTSWDTYIFVGTEWCTQDIGYNDDSCGLQSEVIVALEPGTYHCDVEGFSTCGMYIFDVTDAGMGACCVYDDEGVPTCYDNHEAECDDLGGYFYLGESCDTFECPVPCEESQIDIAILTDPYPGETTWEITLHGTSEVICFGGPYAGQYTLYNERCCIPYDGCVDFTMYDSYGDGIYAPGGFTIELDGEVIFSNMGTGWSGSSISVMNFGGGCVPDTGACCVDQECVATNIQDECDVLGGDWFIFEACPPEGNFVCPPPCGECPEGGIPEAEECGDDTNGGCNMADPQFEPFACMTSVCGTGWFDGGTRDTDWFEYIPDNDDTMTFAVEAEFESLFGLIEQIVPGVPGCANITGYLEPYALQPACEWASVSFPVTAGGTYYVFVAPQFTNVFLCGSGVNDYVATLTGEACICGDFDGDGDVDYDDFYFFLDAFGTCVGDLKYEEVCDFDGDECITLVDYQMWMECYRDANGKGFIAPAPQATSRRPGGQQAPQRPLQP